MSPETLRAIQTALAPIAAKIGEGASYGWGVVLRQQMVVAVGDFIIVGISLIVIIAAVVAGIIAYKTKPYEDARTVLSMFSFFGIVAGLMVLGFAGYDGIAHLVNPDYYALQFFIDLVRPASGN